MAVIPRVLALVAVAVLAACTTRVDGTPDAGATLPPAPEELTAEAVFDDFTTVDPCSLTDLSVFETFGTATFGVPGWLDYCVVSVKPAAGGEVSLSIGLLGELAATPEVAATRVDLERGLWFGQASDDPEDCTRLLVFPDDVTMEVRAFVNGGDLDACPMGEAGMEHAIQVVLDGTVTHREPARNSLVLVDPCTLIDDAQVIAVPGLAGMRKEHDIPADHRCFWRADGITTLAVNFGAARVAESYPDSVGGRPSAVVSVSLDDRSYCSVNTAHIPFTEVSGVGDAVELATVFVHMPADRADAACAAARAVADIVWPKLPSA